jgi:hypothetical protein
VADDPSDPEPLDIDPALLQLPAGYASTGDPVDGNPFPLGTVRYEMWAAATRIAEEKAARVRSEWLLSQQSLNSVTPRTLEEMEQFNALYRNKSRELLGKEFDVWAGRAAQVVFTDNDVRQTDFWLVSYAAACLRANADLMLKHGLPRHVVVGELRWMRESLASRVRHWQAENRRCRSIREEEAKKQGSRVKRTGAVASVKSVDGRGDTAEPPSGSSFQRRAEWLRRELDVRKWTVQEFERQGGPHARTTRKVLRGEHVRETVLEKIVQALSNKGRVRMASIPGD